MEEYRNYQRWHVVGDGELFIGNSKHPFKKGFVFDVLDLSASGVRILTSVELETGMEVGMHMKFSGHVLDISLRVIGQVSKIEKIGNYYEYALRFIGLTEKDKVEIDEAIRMSGNLSF